MNTDLNTVLSDALKLPLYERRELIARLEKADQAIQNKGGDVTRFFGTFSSGDPNSANNEKIDADLAESYLDDHAPEN